jgi:hypothetical protein
VQQRHGVWCVLSQLQAFAGVTPDNALTDIVAMAKSMKIARFIKSLLKQCFVK